MIYFHYYVFFLICLIPALLVTGPFLSDLAVSIVAIIVAASIIKNKSYFIFKNKYFIIFICFNLFMITRSVFAYDPIFSLKVTLFYFRFALFSIGIAYCFYLLNKKSINKFYYCLIATFIIVILDGYCQFIFGYNFFGQPKFHEFRLSGFFGPELILGSYVSKIFPMVMVSFLIIEENKKYFFFKISLLILSSVMLVLLSGERAAFFSIVLFCIIFLILTDLIKFKLKILILIATIFSLAIVLTFSEKTKSRFLDQTIYSFYGGKNYSKSIENSDLENDNKRNQLEKEKELDILSLSEGDIDERDQMLEILSLQNKIDASIKAADNDSKSNNQLVIFTHDTHSHYMSAYKMFLDNKLFGKGVKMFRKLCSKKEFNYNEWSCTSHPHNTYVQLLAETGIFGFLLIFTIFILCLVEIIKIFFKKIFNKKYSVDNVNICLYSFFIIYLWPLMPTGNFFNNWLSIILFFTSGFFLYRNNKIKFNEF
jgi:O-antigen ligase